jgi:para-aminobenzoate synthetase component 1
MNNMMASKEPFVFIIDFEMKKPRIWRLDEIDPDELRFDFSGRGKPGNAEIRPHAIPLDEYKPKFDFVMDRLLYGDSFLTNLTIKTKIESDLDIRQLFDICKAKYKLWLKDSFLVFSPETFVKIHDGMIFSYPMKGTIGAAIPGAETIILSDKKEMAEHVTIVDLIRNDLAMIAEDVHVSRFRYIDRVRTHGKDLLQVSSEIRGTLLPAFAADPAGSFLSLLPAGSVSGAPKNRTLEVIRQAEKEERGYYTGICGFFDGHTLDSGVMIRFIEQAGRHLYYRSGGGITTQSEAIAEYKEAQDKIYVPIY